MQIYKKKIEKDNYIMLKKYKTTIFYLLFKQSIVT